MSTDPTLWFSFSGPRQVKCSRRLSDAAERLRRTHEAYLLAASRDFEPVLLKDADVRASVTRACEEAYRSIVGMFNDLHAEPAELAHLDSFVQRIAATVSGQDSSDLRGFLVEAIRTLAKRVEAADAARVRRAARFREFAPEEDGEPEPKGWDGG